MYAEHRQSLPHLRDFVLERDDHTCQMCGISGDETAQSPLQLHHVVPLQKGGSHAPSNLVTLCPNCHVKRDTELFERPNPATSVYDRTLHAHGHVNEEVRRTHHLFACVILASVFDRSELSAELSEEQKKAVRVVVSAVIGVSVGIPIGVVFGISSGIGVSIPSFAAASYQIDDIYGIKKRQVDEDD